MTQRFSGLGLHLGNLPLLSDARSRSISAENPTGEKGKGGMAEEGCSGRFTPAVSAAAWRRCRPRNASRPARRFCSATSRGRAPFSRSGSRRRMRSLARSRFCASTGTARYSPVGRGASLGDFFACGWGRYAQVSSLAGLRESQAGPSTAIGRCHFLEGRAAFHAREPRSGRHGSDHLLADQLRAD